MNELTYMFGVKSVSLMWDRKTFNLYFVASQTVGSLFLYHYTLMSYFYNLYTDFVSILTAKITV